MLTVDGLAAGYGGLEILHDLSLTVAEGEVVAIVGANGAGKSTLLRTISGLLAPTRGSISFQGRELAGRPPHEIVRRGVIQVPEGRELFGSLTVHENLEMGGYARSRSERAASLREVRDLFPPLAERSRQRADSMSGGEQQMLAIGRALMAGPQLLMLDEPSLGLAPKLVSAVLDAVSRIRDAGITVLLVEQNAPQAIQLADRGYVLESGTVAEGAELLDDERLRRAYLGL